MFHALQSLIAFGILMICHVLGSLFPLLGPILSALIFLASFTIWLLMIYQALRGKWYKLPYVGPIAERQLHHL